MSSDRGASLPSLNVTARRVPKLAVRNKSPEQSDQSLEAGHEADRSGGGRESPQTRPPRSKNQDGLKRSDSKLDKSRSKVESKRKGTSVFGFLTLKEPSTSALEEFAESERKKLNASKGVKLLPGVSSQQIPDHVPKVNSRWDGLPDVAKRKVTEKNASVRNSMISVASRHSNVSDGDRLSAKYNIGSSSSKPSVRQSGESAHSRPGIGTQVQRPTSPPEKFGLDSDAGISPADELPDLPMLLKRSSSSGLGTSPETSPNMPALDSTIAYRLPTAETEQQTGKTARARKTDTSVSQTPRPSVLDPPIVLSQHTQPRQSPKVAPPSKRHGEVAPWEMFEPPQGTSEPPVNITRTSSVTRKTKKFGVRLGLR